MIMSIPYFSGVLLCIAGGVLADRIGLNKVFAVAFTVAALGALGRCFAVDFWTLFAASFVMGTGVAALNANSAKLLRLLVSLALRIRLRWGATRRVCPRVRRWRCSWGLVARTSRRLGG